MQRTARPTYLYAIAALDGPARWITSKRSDFAAPFFKIGGRVEVFRVGAVAFTIEEFHCHERIEKTCDAARMQVEFLADLRACEPALTECAEEIQRDRSQQDLGIPEAERSLQNCLRFW